MSRQIFWVSLLLIVPALAWAASFGWVEYANAPEPATGEMTHGLRIDLEPKEQTIKVGEGANFKVTFFNLGPFPQPLQILRPLDGSEARWQQPFHDFVARSQSGETFRWGMLGSRPPKMKALTLADVIKIPDRQSADPWQGPYCDYLKQVKFDKKGAYEVWYLYYFERVNESRDITGTPANLPLALRGAFTSNAVKVIVQP